MRNKEYPYYNVAEPSDLKELIKYCADIYGDKTAFWYRKKGEEKKISFVQLRNDINAFGTYLHSKDYKGAHIAIMGENSYEWIVSYFAVVNGGNVVVPIDKEATAEDVKFQLDKSDATLFIHSDSYSNIAAHCYMESMNIKSFEGFLDEGKKLLDSGENSFVDTIIDKEKLCAVVFTSGTTADPKGVMLNHKNLAKDMIVSSKNLFVPEGTVALLPFYHTFGFMACVLCQMLKGYPVYINTSLKRTFDDIKYAQPKHISVVPMLLVAMYDKIWNNVRNKGKEKRIEEFN